MEPKFDNFDNFARLSPLDAEPGTLNLSCMNKYNIPGLILRQRTMLSCRPSREPVFLLPPGTSNVKSPLR